MSPAASYSSLRGRVRRQISINQSVVDRSIDRSSKTFASTSVRDTDAKRLLARKPGGLSSSLSQQRHCARRVTIVARRPRRARRRGGARYTCKRVDVTRLRVAGSAHERRRFSPNWSVRSNDNALIGPKIRRKKGGKERRRRFGPLAVVFG